MVWFKHHYGHADYGPEFNRFEQMFISMGAPREMLMIKTGLTSDATVYLSLPDPKLAVMYPGFESMQPADLPSEATLLSGTLG
jgi:hypothetical protein